MPASLPVLLLLLVNALLADAPPLPRGLESPTPLSLNEIRAEFRRAREAREAYLRSGKPEAAFEPEASAILKGMEARLDRASQRESRQLLLVTLYGLSLALDRQPSQALRAALEQELPSTARAWSLDPELLEHFLENQFPGEAEAEAYAGAAREGHADPAIREMLTFTRFERALGERDTVAQEALERLEKGFPQSSRARLARRMWAAQGKLTTGAKAPPLEVPSLEDSRVSYSLDSFRGRHLLVLFWASWCPSCRAELAVQHRVWERFKDRPFDILSLSLDLKAEDVFAFRAQPGTPMPWKHGFLGRGRHPLLESYGVVGIPRPVLLDPEGRVIGSGRSLLGANLEKTLARVLGVPRPGGGMAQPGPAEAGDAATPQGK